MIHYLHLLAVQRRALEQNDLNHVEETISRERQILEELDALAIVRLPEPSEREEILANVDEINSLYKQAAILHRRNRQILAQKRTETAREIAGLKVPPRRKTVYSSTRSSGVMLDIRG